MNDTITISTKVHARRGPSWGALAGMACGLLTSIASIAGALSVPWIELSVILGVLGVLAAGAVWLLWSYAMTSEAFDIPRRAERRRYESTSVEVAG